MNKFLLYLIAFFSFQGNYAQTQTERILQELNQKKEENKLFRYATPKDIASYAEVAEGDYLLTGGNIDSTIIDIKPSRKNTFTIEPTKKILIKGGEYTSISLNLPELEGTEENPVVISTYEGKVTAGKISISGIKHYTLSDEIMVVTVAPEQNTQQQVAKRETPPSSNTSQKSVFRYATAEDAKEIHNANEGDYLITGGNMRQGQNIDIRPNFNNLFTLDNSEKQHKILIKGGDYGYITLIIPGLEGTLKNPIIITNYDGQVKCKRLQIYGMKHVKITGKFDPENQTGDSNYQGHNSGYAYSSGKYGIYIDKAWGTGQIDKSGSFIIHIAGFELNGVNYSFSDIELEYIEAGNGGFSNVFKWDNHEEICDNMSIHDCYFHDTSGEGIYLGNTQGGRQGEFTNLKFFNNRIIRAGWDALQLSRIQSADIFNNVIYGSLCWKIVPLGDYQDKNIQISAVGGEIKIRNNIIIAGVMTFATLKTGSIKTSGKLIIDNNLWLFGRKSGVAYIGENKIGSLLTEIRITNNIYSKNQFLLPEINTSAKLGPALIQIVPKDVPIVLSGNISDGSYKKTRFCSNSSLIKESNNKFVSEIDYPDFIDTGFPIDFDWLLLERWGTKITTGNRKGDPVIFNKGDYIVYKSVIYKAKQDNSGIEPKIAENWDQHWEIVYFNGQTIPPDDFRLSKGSVYAKKGIGLLDKW